MNNLVNTVFVLLVAFLAVFLQTNFNLLRDLLGAQVDLLPALMVYAGLTSGILTVASVAFCGGLWIDSLSLNPLGLSVLPLFIVGFAILQARELLLRNNPFAHLMFGFGASLLVPLMTIFVLFNLGYAPLLGWTCIWKLLVMTVGGGFMTPVFFKIFDKLHETFSYQPFTFTSFRPDRQIERGRK